MKKTLYSIITATALSLTSIGTAQSVTANYPELYSQETIQTVQPVLHQYNLERFLDGSFENGEAIQLSLKPKNEGYVLTLNIITEEEYEQFKRTIYMDGTIENSITPESISVQVSYEEGNKILQTLFERAIPSGTIQEAYDYLQLQIEGLEEVLQKYSTTIEDNKKTIELTLTTLRELTAQIAQFYDNLIRLQEAQEQYDNRLESLERKTNNLEITNKRLVEENNKLRVELEKEVERLEDKIKGVNTTAHLNTFSISKLNGEMNGISYSLDALQTQYEILKSEMKKLQQQLAEEKLNRLKQEKITNEDLQNKITSLEREVKYYEYGSMGLAVLALFTSLYAVLIARKK